ncbi:MAG: PqqD family peptide modification chaperone [Armatimonadetes bacterium]|nr:PqqD family peptide modification chaperone [Armatimonadota bacterium]NIM22727.1 PqqD family peptide modification chaperone [Armatimonadota bacterium]NIM66557.1 PqqD family peptide modification chaperone [Armatimonadota bacterium]NIM75093.1 PqqD family peptide modification chaperone [Armatimonadota bacterium]NIN04777.1 PqqD family peptide modification chaperone [Armatimonadota bacterium]
MFSFDKHVKIRQEKNGAVVFDTLREKVFITDEIGAHILRLMKEGLSAEEMAAVLAERYEQAPEVIQRHLTEFIQQLEESALVTAEEESRG